MFFFFYLFTQSLCVLCHLLDQILFFFFTKLFFFVCDYPIYSVAMRITRKPLLFSTQLVYAF